jgi:hypothetical protein
MDNLRQRYLDVLSKTLVNYYYKPMSIQSNRIMTEYDLQHGTEWPDKTLSMIGLKAMMNIKECVETVIRDQIPGDLVETGVWRGGASIFMAAILDSYQETINRKLFVCDSFQGLPPPDPNCVQDRGDTLHTVSYLAVPLEEVKHNFNLFNLNLENVIFVKGWFKDTLHTLPTNQISVLRLDGDMYQSTMDGLNALYDKVSNGGFIIIDDYGLEGCRKAVDDFRTWRNIKSPMIQINDCKKMYWQKQPSHGTFVVTNCLNVSSSPLCYTTTRSVYTQYERQTQLFKTFDSILKHASGNPIYYVESSKLTESQRARFNEYLNDVKKRIPVACIQFIDLSEYDDIVRERDSPYKGCCDLLMFSRALELYPCLKSFEYLWKMNGRYELSDKFDSNLFSSDKYSFKQFVNSDSSIGVYTFLWGLPSTLVDDFVSRLSMFDNYLKQGKSLEYGMLDILPHSLIYSLSLSLGVTGNIAVSGDYVCV